MKPCIHCGGEGKAFKRQIHAIMANRMPYYSTTEAGLAGFPERGFG
jgi:hypothetical protein